jgi:hypothetical protein
MGHNAWGDRSFFTSQGYPSLSSICANATTVLGTTQFPLTSGDIHIGLS